MTQKSVLDSKLYITEAGESKKRAEDELAVADPANDKIENLIAKHGITNQRDGATGNSDNK